MRARRFNFTFHFPSPSSSVISVRFVIIRHFVCHAFVSVCHVKGVLALAIKINTSDGGNQRFGRRDATPVPTVHPALRWLRATVRSVGGAPVGKFPPHRLVNIPIVLSVNRGVIGRQVALPHWLKLRLPVAVALHVMCFANPHPLE